MSILALLAAGAGTGTPVDPPPESTLTPPYNAVTPLTLPATHGGAVSGRGAHPDVIDMVALTGSVWNGHRYWMAWTPYPGELEENPCVGAFDVPGENPVVPVGLSNPIYPYQGSGWNSDTEIIYDEPTNRLGVLWRSNYITHPDSTTDALERWNLKWSTDGVTWGERIDVLPPWPNEGASLMSPAMVERGPGDWHMFHIGIANGTQGPAPGGHRTATSPTGPWSAPTRMAFSGLAGHVAAHINVIFDEGQFRGLVHTNSPRRLLPCVSDDGTAWRFGPSIMEPLRSWEAAGFYRSAFLPAENPADYDLWYTGTNADVSGWQIGYTQVPKHLWWSL